MNALNLIDTLDAFLPDEQVIRDVYQLLRESGENGQCEIALPDERRIWIPVDVEVVVTHKALRKRFDHQNNNFGIIVAEVALGGVAEFKFGFLTPRYCFALLYYDETGHHQTEDFYNRDHQHYT